MKIIYTSCIIALLSLFVSSCAGCVEGLIAKGKYTEAEKRIKKMKGDKKYECAEALIREYIDIEEYDRAVFVYEKITPEHCDNDDLDYTSLYGHGVSGSYEESVTKLFRKTFMEAGDYDKVWQYCLWQTDSDSGYNAPAYYKFMSEVILYLCSTGNKVEANRFLNHYVFWFDTRVDNTSYSDDYPEFHCDVARSKLQRIINTY